MATQTMRSLPIDGRLARRIDKAMEDATAHPWSSEALRCQLSDDVAAFIASGGTIKIIPLGVSGEPEVTLAAYQMERHGNTSRYRNSAFY